MREILFIEFRIMAFGDPASPLLSHSHGGMISLEAGGARIRLTYANPGFQRALSDTRVLGSFEGDRRMMQLIDSVHHCC